MSKTEKISTAQAPFDNPECEIILRSADGVDFHVFKLILSLVSTVFQGMFTLPQDMQNSGTPTFNSLEKAKAVLEAARKYDMGAVLIRARDIVFTQFLPTDSLGLYALSCMFGWWQHCQMAAARTLEINLKDLGRWGNEFTGMRDISAFDYHKLLVYHYECGIAAQAVGNSLTWLTSPSDDMCMFKYGSGTSTCECVKKDFWLGKGAKRSLWFDEYLVSSGKELYARPCESILEKSPSYNRAINKALDCKYCRSLVVRNMDTFRTLYAA